MKLAQLVKKAVAAGASDIHIVSGLPPSVRVAGEIMTLEGDALGAREINDMIYEVLNEKLREQFERDWQLCFSIVMDGLAHIRISVYTRLGVLEAAVRLRPFELRTLEELGLPPAVAELTSKPNGLILVTGPTGVGKTTTLYSMIDRINSERRVKIITVEDPIEYLHPHRRSIVIQQEIGRDAKTFHLALMHILRLDPDVICVGELRDGDTIAAALLAAETGHLVIATLHTVTAAQTVERILTAVPAGERAGAAVQLANCLRGVVTQQLLPSVDRKSQVLACEIMLANQAVRNCVKDNRLQALNDAIQTSGSEGMRSMDFCLRDLHQAGRITYDTAVTYAREPKLIMSADKNKESKRKPELLA